MKNRIKVKKIVILVLFLIIVVVGGVLFIGAVSGWFDGGKVLLDAEYQCEGECDRLIELDIAGYDDLVLNKKSFIVFVDQEGCTTADRLREYITKYAEDNKILVYKMMFVDVKKTSLYDAVKYYPSVAIISKGRVLTWLKADSDDDVKMYNSYEDFCTWLQQYL